MSDDPIPTPSPSGDPLKPTIGLLVKVGSFVRHVEEADSDSAHEFDWSAIRGLAADHEVREWMSAMDAMALLPVKR